MPVPYDADTSAFREQVDQDILKWYDTLQQNKPALEKRQIQVSQQTLESSPIAFGRDVIVPQGGGGAAAPTVCEGDFEGDYSGLDESLVDVNVDLPYNVTIVYVELTGSATEGNTRIGYGGEGEGSSFVNFAESSGPFIGIAPDRFTWTADPQQPVPTGGFIQIDIGDWTSGDPTGSFHYKIHYTYNCADAP